MTSRNTFTGRDRARRTRFGVRAADGLARNLITVGGIGTIVCVMLVCLFLASVVLPLFAPARLGEPTRITWDVDTGNILHLEVDEFRVLGWSMWKDGRLRVTRLDTGEPLQEIDLFPDRTMTAASFATAPVDEDDVFRKYVSNEMLVACAFEDGHVALGKVAFQSSFYKPAQIPPELLALGRGKAAPFENGMLLRAGGGGPSGEGTGRAGSRGQFRAQHVIHEFLPSFDVADEPIARIDYVVAPPPRSGPLLAVLTEDDDVKLVGIEARTSKLDLETTYEIDDVAEVAYEAASPPDHLLLSGRGDSLFLVWNDGRLLRYDVRKLADVRLAEELDVVPDDATLTAAGFALGRNTLVFGDSQGALSAWFVARPPSEAIPSDQIRLPEDGVLVKPDGFVLSPEAILKQPDEFRLPEQGVRVTPDSFTLKGDHGPIPPEGVRVPARDVQLSQSGVPVFSEWLQTPDYASLIEAHTFPPRNSPVVSLDHSWLGRLMIVGYGDGVVRACHLTTSQVNVEGEAVPGEPVEHVVLAPNNDAIVAVSGSDVYSLDFAPRHPEASLSSLFLPVHYEGYWHPRSEWQSSSGSQETEPKLGMMPLVFGTLKATFYSMLFGAPLALLAAIYTSEFLTPRTRGPVKTSIEVMASLPSVVLGFLAALVIAPFVAKVLPTLLTGMVTVPFVLLLGAYLWQLLPHETILALERYRLPFIALLLPLGALLAVALGPRIETLFFAGDIDLWLDGQAGTGTGAWLILLLPLSAIGSAFLSRRLVAPRMVAASATWTRGRFVFWNLLRFLAACAFTLLFAWGLSWSLTAAGFDPRGTYVDTYDDRNALVVGFVMGFAIIPIIYTIAEDALSSVPDQLRAASLGAGATPWQTALRIVVPTATSGLFSALMVGLGRAVGETMIVLMAGGNTPVTEWNVFNGFLTLAANIATELPEAAKGSTHYRTLFMAALTLFVMTFVVNTAAELVRIHFRRRVVQL